MRQVTIEQSARLLIEAQDYNRGRQSSGEAIANIVRLLVQWGYTHIEAQATAVNILRVARR